MARMKMEEQAVEGSSIGPHPARGYQSYCRRIERRMVIEQLAMSFLAVSLLFAII